MTSSPRDHSFFSAGQAGAQAGSFKSAPRDILLSGIAESRECEVEAPRAEQIQKSPDVCCATHWNDGNTFGVETPTAAGCERLERELVTDPFHEYYGPRRRPVCRPRKSDSWVERAPVILSDLDARQCIGSEMW